MINKRKKYHGGLKVLFSLLFIMLLGMYSSCYAVDYSLPFSQTEVDQINNFYNFNYTLSDYNLAYQKLKEKYPTLTKLNIFFVSKPEYVSTEYLIMAPNNGTFNNELLYTCIRPPDGTSYNFFGLFLRESAQSGWGTGWISILSTNSNNKATIKEINTVGENVFYTNKTQQQPTIENYILTSPLILTTIRTQSFYYRDVNYNPAISVFSSNFITLDGDPEPEEPSGDVGTGTGTITNPSGEVTGQIDLNGIENGIIDVKNTISGEGQAIRENDNKNTEEIVNAINNSNENYWGSDDDLTGEEQEENIEENLNELMENLEENLTQSEVIQALESGEAGFLNFFRNKGEEQAYDLEFQWNKVNYMGATLLESGDINISAMCREIPEMGQLQTLIRVIFNFGTAIAIIHQIYNLVLSTLGIDNPYLYEDGQEITTIDTETGEYRQFYKRRRRKL